MTDDSVTRVPLGVGGLIGDSFGLLFRSGLPILTLAFAPALVISLLGWLVVAPPPEPVPGGPLVPVMSAGMVLLGLLDVIAGFLIMGLVVLAAYDASAGRRRPLGDYVAPVIVHLPAIVVLGIAVTVLVSIGLVFLVIPGLYVAAVFWVMVPAIVVEGAGWRGMGRSMALTRGYRWPIMAAGIVLFLVLIVISILVIAPIGVIFGMAGLGGLLAAVIEAAVSAVYYGLIGIFTALLYARLREIKEGVGVDDIVRVFE